jgi:hypothetical protein
MANRFSILLFSALMVLLCALLVTPPGGSMVTVNGYAMSIAIFAGSYLHIRLLPVERLFDGFLSYIAGMMTVLAFTVVAVTCNFSNWFDWWPKINYGQHFHEYFSFPFLHTDHSSFYVGMATILFLGLVLSSPGRHPAWYSAAIIIAMVSLATLAIFLSGSRSGIVVFVAALACLITVYMVWGWFSNGSRRPQWVWPVMALVVGVLIGSIAVRSNSDKPGVKRAAWLATYDLYDLVTARADPARHAMWSRVVPFLNGSEWSQGSDQPIEGFDVESEVALGNFHSMFINLFIWGGIIPGVSLVAFFLCLIATSVRSVLHMWNSTALPLLLACTILLCQALIFTVYQPFEYFAPLWVILGAVAAILTIRPRFTLCTIAVPLAQPSSGSLNLVA